jgi:hypothetical protein
MTRLKTIDAWLARTFQTNKTDSAKVAVAITEGLQTSIKLGIVSTVAHTVGWILPRTVKISQKVIVELDEILPATLAAELNIEPPLDHTSKEDFQDFGEEVITAFNVRDDYSKLWTVLACRIDAALQRDAGQPSVPFSRLVIEVEKAYQELKADQAELLNERSAPSPIFVK